MVRWSMVAALAGAAFLAASTVPAGGPASTKAAAGRGATMQDDRPGKLVLTETEWRARLTPEAYRILRERRTERAFSGRFWNEHRDGIYVCAGCGQPLFDATAKFDSGTGWPSYFEPIDDSAVETEPDRSWFTVRTEVHCARCGGHLGHVFEDGPAPTGLRYCINSAALEFRPRSPRDASARQSRD